MPYSPDQRRLNSIYAAYGYKTENYGDIGIDEITEGDEIIILNKNGEPIMSGVVSEINAASVKVGDEWYSSSGHQFRRI